MHITGLSNHARWRWVKEEDDLFLLAFSANIGCTAATTIMNIESKYSTDYSLPIHHSRNSLKNIASSTKGEGQE